MLTLFGRFMLAVADEEGGGGEWPKKLLTLYVTLGSNRCIFSKVKILISYMDTINDIILCWY